MLSARSDHEGREVWRARLARAVNFVDVDDTERHLEGVVTPALNDVAEELNQRGQQPCPGFIHWRELPITFAMQSNVVGDGAFEIRTAGSALPAGR